ncbi:MAG: hypothetical protein JHC31_14160 [Sulfurihydrogenibium sp.]|jgi:hypothetical protein|nr:hypothetical protein [Sulfurihydrogenibium sp.]
MVIIRDVNKNPVMIIEKDKSIDVLLYRDRIIRVKLRKYTPESVMILIKKIEEGIITTEELLAYAT